MREIPWTLSRGFLMGSADVVPGVSGGTIALVLRIYERLIASIRAGSSALGRLLRLDGSGAAAWLGKVEWTFIVALLAGIGLAIVALAGVLEEQLRERPIALAALFLGLVAGSVIVTWQMLHRRDALRIGVLLATAGAVFVVLGLRGGTTDEAVRQLSDVGLVAFFLAGALAVCAMILPGISGSFILVLLGMYGPVLAVVNRRDFGSAAVFALGAIVGLALFSQFLYWALNRHHDTVIAALIGLMVGSLRVLWPWPLGVASTRLGAPDEAILQAIGLAIVGFVGVVGLSLLAARLDRRTAEPAITSPQ